MFKQYIIVRKDLNMSKGRIAAQVAHASLLNVLQTGIENLPEDIQKDLNNGFPFTKVILSTNSFKEFQSLAFKLMNKPFYLMVDNGFYDKKGNEVCEPTCFALFSSSKIKELESLKLL